MPLARSLALCAAAFVGTTTAALADWPEKPVTIVAGFSEGGGVDTLVRFVAAGLEERLGQDFIVTNKPGSGGGVTAAYVAEQEADGYTLGAAITVTFSFESARAEPKYTYEDFAYVGGIHEIYLGLMATGSRDWKTWDDVVALGKEQGYLRYAPLFPIDRIMLAAAAKQEGFEIDVVPVGGGSKARAALIAGDVDLITSGASGFKLTKDGTGVVVATPGGSRLDAFPDVQTFSELGYAGVIENHGIIFAPAGAPDEAVAKLQGALADIAKSQEYIDLVSGRLRSGAGYVPGDTLAATIADQTAVYKTLLSEIGE